MKRVIRATILFFAVALATAGIPFTVLADTESLYPDGETFVLTELTGAYTDVDEDPDSPDGNWLLATGNNVNTAVEASFPTPSGNPTIGADLQEFRVLVRQYDEAQTGTPSARIELWENGVLVRAGSDTDVPDGGIVLSFTWNANELSTADGSLVECNVVGTKSGGAPSARNSVEVGAVEWNVVYTGAVDPPTVVTYDATLVEETSATLEGEITATGGENADERGFQYGTASGPPYTDNWTEVGSFGTGTFDHNQTGLTKGELYYYRACAHNSGGWGYGSQFTFLTKPDEPTALGETSQGSGWIALSWTTGAGSQKTMVRYRTDQYPTSPSDGTQAYFDTGSSCNVTSLSSNQIYYFRAWSYATEGGKEQYSDSTSDDTAYTRPTDPTALNAYNPSTSTIDLSWTKGDATHTEVRGKAGSYPASVTDGYQVYYGTDSTAQDTSLNPNTAYYYRAWAYNTTSTLYSEGYSQDYETTLVAPPIVTTNPATSIEETTAQLNGNITDTGGDNVTERGFEWDIDSGEPYTDNWTEVGSFGTGSYNHGLTSLTKGELYYFRAIAKNSEGWGNGSELKFLTKPDEPTSLQDTSRGVDWIGLSWSTGQGSDNTTIRYRTDQYPTGPSDGTLAYEGSASSCNVTSLSSGQIYYFRAWSHAYENGEEQYSDLTSDDTGYTKPAGPTSLDAHNPTGSSIDLDWTKGEGGDKTMVRRKTGDFPTDPADGAQAYFGTANTTTDSGLDQSTNYYYRAWAYDSDSTYYSNAFTSDNETTTASSVDPPTVTNDGGATNIRDLEAILRGEITDNGNEDPSVTVYWGKTDEGEISGNWTYSRDLGVKGVEVFSTEVANLEPETLFHYRCYAVNSGGSDWADTSANFTTTTFIILPPTEFKATLVSDTHIDLSWVKGHHAVNTLIKAKYGDYPIDRFDGYQVYYGTESNYSDTLVDLQFRDTDVYYRAWSENPKYSWSEDPAEITIGGQSMTALIELIAVALFVWLAFWARHPFFYLLAIPVAITFGLSWYDRYPTPAGITLSAVIAGGITLFFLYKLVVDLYARVVK